MNPRSRLGLAGGGGGERWRREAGTGSVGYGGRSSMRGDGRRLRPVVVWVGEEARGSWGWGSGRRRDEWEDAGGEENR
jgi:hypothetical protein